MDSINAVGVVAVGEIKASADSTIDRDGSREALLTAHAGVHRLCHGCRNPVAVFSLPEGVLIEVNGAFRGLFGVPDPLPAELTILSLGAPELSRVLRTWDGAEPRRIRGMTLGGIEGRGKLLAIPAAFPLQAFLEFIPNRARVDERRLNDLLKDRLQQIGNFERLRALGETAAVIVHELRAPISSVQLGIEMVRSTPSLDPALRSRLDVALEQLGRLDRLLGNIRNFARPRRLAARAVDLRKAFSSAVASVEASLRGPRTTVAIQVRPDPLWIVADPDCLAEVIERLIVNAVEARPEGGAISLSAALSASRRGWVEIRVVDEGAGIPPSLMNRMFQPFFTTKRTGTGLGLAIVRNLVELHGGFVRLESVPGRGTTVTIDLPVGHPEP
jgi:signal transduction histidine kinase